MSGGDRLALVVLTVAAVLALGMLLLKWINTSNLHAANRSLQRQLSIATRTAHLRGMHLQVYRKYAKDLPPDVQKMLNAEIFAANEKLRLRMQQVLAEATRKGEPYMVTGDTYKDVEEVLRNEYKPLESKLDEE